MDYLTVIYVKTIAFLTSPELLEKVVNNRFMLILLVIVLLKMKYATYSSMWLCSLINIPGTVLHETSHFLIGGILNAAPTHYSLIPHRTSEGHYVMGSVGFRNITFYNAIPSALAPLLLLILGYYLNRWFFANVHISIWTYTLYVFAQTIIIENAIPSGTDFRVAFSLPLGILLYAVLGGLALIYIL